MALSNALLIADVAHTRFHPKRNAFRYTVYYLCFALRDRALLRAVRFLGINQGGLFSFHDADHGAGGPDSEEWVRGLLQAENIHCAVGDITLITLPRVMGYAFNPVSFWLCHDQQGQLRAVVSEVNNTFGDRHFYISCHGSQQPIESTDWLRARKMFHVSPFLAIEGHYRFRFDCSDEKVAIAINHHNDEGQLLLATSMIGPRQPLTGLRLLFCFFRYPLVTLKVIGLIHYQAIKLLLKGLPYRTRPLPPTAKVSR